VTSDASESEIKSAYRKAALKYHPDKQASRSDEEKAEAEAKFKEIGEAYEILTNPEKKARYDEGMPCVYKSLLP
jgi:DnaJ-class molecular chaperone